MPKRVLLRSILALACCCATGLTARAAVVVVSNRAAAEVAFSVVGESADALPPRAFKLAAGDVTPITLQRPAQIVFTSAGERKTFKIVPYGVYYFGQPAGGALDLAQIGLSTPPATVNGQPPPPLPPETESAAVPPSVVIPVKIVYDENEVSSSADWERRLRARFNEASAIFKKTCFVEFKIVAVGSWHLDKPLDSLVESLAAFERSVEPGPARLAVGFTAQAKRRSQDDHMGGTRGPLNTHLLLREWTNRITEAERLEVLVHELGHFLGAVHSPESTSVMRPKLGDHQARFVKFRIGFDPLNAMAMCLVSQELRLGSKGPLASMHPATRVELLRIYIELARAMPKDPSALDFMKQLGVAIRPAASAEEP